MLRSRRRRGFALIVVLWLAVILGLLASSVATTSIGGLREANSGLKSLQAEMAADGATWIGIERLSSLGPDGWRVNGTIYGWRMADHEVRVRITDEYGRFDLNRASALSLSGLLQAAGLSREDAEETAEAIVTMRQDRMAARVKADPALARWAGHGMIAEPEELLNVPGISPALYARIADAVTVHSAQTKPKQGLINPLVRAAVGMRAIRSSEPTGTNFPRVSGDVPSALTDPDIETSGFSGLVRVEAEAMAPDGTRFARLAVIKLPKDRQAPIRTLLWRRGQASLFD